MGVDRTEVRFETTGEQQAAADVRAIEREMQRLEQRARNAETAVRSAKAAGGTGTPGFGQKLKQYVRFGPQGFSLNKGILKASGALMVVAAAHGLAATAEQVMDGLEWIDELRKSNVGGDEIARQLGLKASEKIFDASGASSLVKAGLRVAGVNREVTEEAFNLAFSTAAQQAAQERAERAANRKVRLMMEAALAKADRDREAALEKLTRDSEDQLNKQLAGLGNETLPIGLNRATAQRYRALREEQVRQGAKIRQQQARDKIMQAGEGD